MVNYKDQFIAYKALFAKYDRYVVKFQEHRAAIVEAIRNIKTQGVELTHQKLCSVVEAFVEYLEENEISSDKFSRLDDVQKNIHFVLVAGNAEKYPWMTAEMVALVYPVIYKPDGTQRLN